MQVQRIDYGSYWEFDGEDHAIEELQLLQVLIPELIENNGELLLCHFACGDL